MEKDSTVKKLLSVNMYLKFFPVIHREFCLQPRHGYVSLAPTRWIGR
jgi:hypothetical protein